jgi:hypothetical protein
VPLAQQHRMRNLPERLRMRGFASAAIEAERPF